MSEVIKGKSEAAESGNSRPQPVGGQTPGAAVPSLTQTLQAAALQSPASNETQNVTGYTLDRRSPGLLDWLLDGQAAHKHREVMNLIRDTGIETMEAMNVSSMLTADFVANSLDTENTMEQIILQYRDSQMVRASAPVYVQLARAMQMETVPAIAQAGMNRIRRKIEQR